MSDEAQSSPPPDAQPGGLERDESSLVEITFKSGAKTIVEVQEFSVSKNGFGALVSADWVHAIGERLLWLDLGEVAAVVARRAPASTTDDQGVTA